MLRQVSLSILLTLLCTFADHAMAQSASGVWSSKFPTPPGANGPVHAMTVFESDLIVGGQFTEIAGIPAIGLAKFDGQTWSEFGGGIQSSNNAVVFALLSEGTNLYVGGHFETIGSIPASNIARRTNGRWEPLGSGISTETIYGASPDSAVYALYSAGSNLFVGGEFHQAGSTPVRHIALWNETGWHALDQGVYFPTNSYPLMLPPGRVSAITGDGTNVFVGGWFIRSGDVATTNLAMWNGATWQSIGSPSEGVEHGWWDGEKVSGRIRSLAWHDGSLYAAGDFTRMAGLAISNIARWTNSKWEIPITVDGPTQAIESIGDELYLMGGFNSAADASGSFAATNIVKFRDGDWTPIHAPTPPRDLINAVAKFGGKFLVGGSFTSMSGVAAGNISAFVDAHWEPIVEGRANSLHRSVTSITSDGINTYVAGDIVVAGTNQTRTLAKWDGRDWTSIPPPAPDAFILGVQLVGSTLFASGSFQMPELGARDLASWDGQQWSAVGNPSEAAAYNTSLLALGSNLFTSTFRYDETGRPTNALKWWNGNQWQIVPWVLPGYSEERLATDGTNLFIARSLFDPDWNRIARWDGTNLFEYPSRLGVGSMRAFGVGGTNIWISANGIDAPGGNVLVGWNGASWIRIHRFTGADYIGAIIGMGNKMIVAGQFSSIGGVAANSIAQWDGSKWQPLDDGVLRTGKPGTIRTLTVSGNRLFAGGEFDQAGPNPSGNVALWHQATDISLTILPNQLIQLQITGGTGDHIQIEGSDSLQNWTRLTSFTLPTSTNTATDPSPITTTNRFYRARILEP